MIVSNKENLIARRSSPKRIEIEEIILNMWTLFLRIYATKSRTDRASKRPYIHLKHETSVVATIKILLNSFYNHSRTWSQLNIAHYSYRLLCLSRACFKEIKKKRLVLDRSSAACFVHNPLFMVCKYMTVIWVYPSQIPTSIHEILFMSYLIPNPNISIKIKIWKTLRDLTWKLKLLKYKFKFIFFWLPTICVTESPTLITRAAAEQLTSSLNGILCIK